MTLSPNTERQYAGALASFDDWLKSKRRRFPVPPAGVAAYLKVVHRRSGASAVPAHLSAVAHYYRLCGLSFDTKQPAIQRVLKLARLERRG